MLVKMIKKRRFKKFRKQFRRKILMGMMSIFLNSKLERKVKCKILNFIYTLIN